MTDIPDEDVRAAVAEAVAAERQRIKAELIAEVPLYPPTNPPNTRQGSYWRGWGDCRNAFAAALAAGSVPVATPLPTLDGITAELAEHSATLDHALDQDDQGEWWFCKTCVSVATPTEPGSEER